MELHAERGEREREGNFSLTYCLRHDIARRLSFCAIYQGYNCALAVGEKVSWKLNAWSQKKSASCQNWFLRIWQSAGKLPPLIFCYWRQLLFLTRGELLWLARRKLQSAFCRSGQGVRVCVRACPPATQKLGQYRLATCCPNPCPEAYQSINCNFFFF